MKENEFPGGGVSAPERGVLRGGGSQGGAVRGAVRGGRFGVRNPPQGLNIYRVLMFRV